MTNSGLRYNNWGFGLGLWSLTRLSTIF